MNLVKNVQESFNLYVKNFVLLVLASLIAGVISVVTLGILAGPVIGGLLILGLKMIRGEKGDLNELFAHFDQFLPTLVATLLLWGASIVVYIIGNIPVIGWIANFVVNPVLFLLYFLTIGFIVEQNRPPLQAIQRSIACFAGEWAQLWLYSFAMLLIGGIGYFIFLIGAVLTIPFGMIGMTLAYQQLSGKEPVPFKLEKQILQKAGIGLAVLLVIGVICTLFGTGRSSSIRRRTDLGVTSKILSRVTGGQIEIDQKGGRFKIGDLSFGSGLPENFPKDIPIYPRAEVDGFIGGKDDKLSGSTTILTSKDSAGEIYDYYIKNLENKGWSVTPQDLGEMKMINFQKGNRSGVITINPKETECDILIGLSVE